MRVLTVENLSFNGFGPVNLTVTAGERIGIRGPSGSGKSMLLKAVADMIPHTGRVSLDGVENIAFSGPGWRKQVGLLPAESAWWFDRVGDHFNKSSGNNPLTNKLPGNKLLDEWIVRLGFDEQVSTWQVAELSTGERQRLSLIRLLANRPAVLLLDEPTANLDNDNAAAAENLILDYQNSEQAAILWVGHDIEQLERVCDRIFTLQNGVLNP